MEKKFRRTKIASCVGLILTGGMIASGNALADDCTTVENGVCNLKEFEMTTPGTPHPTSWYFTEKTQNASINKEATKQNIYFASGTSARGEDDVQRLLVDGADLNGYYINTSKNGTAYVRLANNAQIDWIEAGGSSTTHNHFDIDNSTLTGAKEEIDYDQRGKYKGYAKGAVIYTDGSDKGELTVNVRNNSVLHGSILAKGAGAKTINIKDSEIKGGGISIASARNENTVNVSNSTIDTTNAVAKTDKAISISTLLQTAGNHISLDNSQLTGSVSVSTTNGTNDISLTGTTLERTGLEDALIVVNGKDTAFNATDSKIIGNANITSKENINASLTNTQLTGDISLKKALTSTLNLVKATVEGSLRANSGDVSLNLRENTTISGDIVLNEGDVKSANVLLDNAQIGGHLYGNKVKSTLSLANSMASFDGDKFSGFNALNVEGTTTLANGFTDNNVGNALKVTGGTLTAPISLALGKLSFDASKVIADSLSLRDTASLELTKGSMLQTSATQLFNQAANALETGGYNDSGSRVTFNNSTLALTDALFTLDYVKSANALMGQHDGSALVMMGELVDGHGETGAVDIKDASIANSVLAQVQVTSDKNHIIIGSAKAPHDDHIAVENGFGAAQLVLAGTNGASVTLENDQSLTLTGALGGSLIHTENAPDTLVDVQVNNGTLNLGSQATGGTSATLNGTVNIASNGTLNVDSGIKTITNGAGVISSGAVNVKQNATLNSDIKLADSGTMNVHGNLNAGTLTAHRDAQISVGNELAAGSLHASNVDLQGARLFLDPAWTSGSTIKDASKAVFAGNDVNGRISVGQNSLLVLGDTTADSAYNAFANSGFLWGKDGITAALSINASQTLDSLNGGLRVDGSLTSDSTDRDATQNQAEFADDSLFMVNIASTTGGNAALTAQGGTLKVSDAAALYVADAKANQQYTITQGFDDVEMAANGWNGENLAINKLLNATTTENNGTVTVSTTAKDARDVMPGVVMANALNTMIREGINSIASADAGIRFLSKAIEAPGASLDEAVKTINSAAQIAVAGGVQNTTLSIGTRASDAIQNRNSIMNHALEKTLDNDASFWVDALYGNNRVRDLQAANTTYGYNTNFYGLMLGGDKSWDTSQGKMRSGAAFHAGNGKTNSHGDFNSTRNDFDFWGVSAYQTWSRNGVNLIGDVGFTAANNDLSQRLPGWMDFGDKLKGSVDSQLLTAGIAAEYLIETPVVDIIPHAGVRYNQLVTKELSTKAGNNEVVFNTERERQDIWQFPAGVKMNKTFALDSGWALSAQGDLAVIAAAGDTSANSKVRAKGIRATDTLSADVIDDTAFNGQLGMKLQKGNMTFGIGYNINASENITGQSVSATYKLAF
ncbi:autotransporter outer membrane beta-barrel domain-containing protein [Salmonella enterica]|nr:autotransporter outer membrane beta-barrel domain-containing protein [Salmonella enterica]